MALGSDVNMGPKIFFQYSEASGFSWAEHIRVL